MAAEAERQYGDFVVARAAPLVRFAFLLCGDWHRAEDTVQSALVKLYLAWPRLNRLDAVEPYVRRIILRVLADNGRLARFRKERLSDQLPERPAADGSDAADDRMVLLSALAALPPRQRAVVVLRFWEDQSIEQCADVLGCSKGTVKSQAARGLQTLRNLLGDQFLASKDRG
jgi:RNA polymerase sigma-70 factor (sigma-E family)